MSHRRGRDEAVERPKERRERLAGAGRRADQHVLAGRDRRPRLRLRGRRLLERVGEPVAHARGERRTADQRSARIAQLHATLARGRASGAIVHADPASELARPREDRSSIASVSRPVKVFCWLGW